MTQCFNGHFEAVVHFTRPRAVEFSSVCHQLYVLGPCQLIQCWLIPKNSARQMESSIREPFAKFVGSGNFCRGEVRGDRSIEGQVRSLLYHGDAHPHDERRSNLPLKQPITTLVQVSTGAVPLAGETLGPLGERYERARPGGGTGAGGGSRCPTAGAGGAGPLKDRGALARAFLAKAVLDVPTTPALVEAARTEPTLRRLCGWEAAGWGAERGDLLARLCGIRRQRPAGAPA